VAGGGIIRIAFNNRPVPFLLHWLAELVLNPYPNSMLSTSCKLFVNPW
jgi:hypothetical protein